MRGERGVVEVLEMMAYTKYYRAEEVALQLQCSVATVRRLLREGRIPGVRLGGRRLGWRVAPEALAQLIREGIPPAVTPPAEEGPR